MKRWISSALLASAPVSHAFAQAASGPPAPALGLLQAILGLGLVIGLILATGWVMRRVAPSALTRGPIRILGQAAVGPRERVVLIQCQGEILTLGVAPGHVSLLQSRPAQPVAGATGTTDIATSADGAAASPTQVAASAPNAFAARLRQLLVRGGT